MYGCLNSKFRKSVPVATKFKLYTETHSSKISEKKNSIPVILPILVEAFFFFKSFCFHQILLQCCLLGAGHILFKIPSTSPNY